MDVQYTVVMAGAGGSQERSSNGHTVMTWRQHDGRSGNHQRNQSGVKKNSSLMSHTKKGELAGL